MEALANGPAEAIAGGTQTAGDGGDWSIDTSDLELDSEMEAEENFGPLDEDGPGNQPANDFTHSGTEPPYPSAETETADGFVSARDLFTLKHLGKERQVPREEVVALAQKGLDYDHVRQKAERLGQLIRGAVPGGQTETGTDGTFTAANAEAARRSEEVLAFARRFPGVTEVPKEVWAHVRSGEPLLYAYLDHRNRSLSEQLSAREQEEKNRRRTPGSVSSSGERAENVDLFLAGWNSV
jgi:hypothetical protein